MSTFSRRTFIQVSSIGGLLGLSASQVLARTVTPSEVQGPFYPVTPQKDRDFDLTSVEGGTGTANGEVVVIQGRVVDQDGQPIEDATIDLWQANAAGRYRHPHDSNPAALDPNFQGWAIVQSGKGGTFGFKTIVPGAYPVSGSWTRPPHIHFKVSKRGYAELVTQMYFPDQALNDVDRLLQRKSPTEQALMISRRVSDEPEVLEYTITLQKV